MPAVKRVKEKENKRKGSVELQNKVKVVKVFSMTSEQTVDSSHPMVVLIILMSSMVLCKEKKKLHLQINDFMNC